MSASDPDLSGDPGVRAAIPDAVAGLEAETTCLLAFLVRQRSLLGHEHDALDTWPSAVHRDRA